MVVDGKKVNNVKIKIYCYLVLCLATKFWVVMKNCCCLLQIPLDHPTTAHHIFLLNSCNCYGILRDTV